jgi:ABC-2 type transport system permease protein
MQSVTNILTVMKRELKGYFGSMFAYVLIFIFVILSMAFGFIISDWLKKGDASLVDFFIWHPWLYMLIGPAIGMRLWSEEQRRGTIELLLTMPVATWEVIVGKFLAACCVLLAALVATSSMALTVYGLGEPDGGMMLAGYVGSFLVGAATIAITCAISAVTRDQVACLLVSVVIIFFLVLGGFQPFQDFMSRIGADWLASLMANGSLMQHSNWASQGRISLFSLIYFVSVIIFSLFLTSVIIRSKRA